jgi:hypothetical protein
MQDPVPCAAANFRILTLRDKVCKSRADAARRLHFCRPLECAMLLMRCRQDTIERWLEVCCLQSQHSHREPKCTRFNASTMIDTGKAIQEFWRWFECHLADFNELTDPNAPFWETALDRLQRINKRLRFEVSHAGAEEREFIITAEGHLDAFPLAEKTVAEAPQISRWRFIALKPPMGFDFTTTYEGIRFEPRQMWFLPLTGNTDPAALGLRIGIPEFRSATARQASNAVAVILDTALGERAAALDIQHFEVVALPACPESEGYIELHQLPNFIEWRKKKRGEV